MSDVSQGSGWWLASDGKWYPPQQAATMAPPPPPPPVYQRPKKPFYKHVVFWVLLVIVLLVGGCIGIVAGVSHEVVKNATEKHTIVYEVTGSGTSTATNITYATVQEGSGQNGEAQVTGAALPWTKTITASGLITVFSLSVQNGPVGLSYVVCTIKEDGKVINTNRANGPYAIASCNSTGK